jgi:hypothetical protein
MVDDGGGSISFGAVAFILLRALSQVMVAVDFTIEAGWLCEV